MNSRVERIVETWGRRGGRVEGCDQTPNSSIEAEIRADLAWVKEKEGTRDLQQECTPSTQQHSTQPR